jgi:hypothetical protein
MTLGEEVMMVEKLRGGMCAAAGGLTFPKYFIL